MMTWTYDDAGETYDDVEATYQGYVLTGEPELLLDGLGVPELAYSGPKMTARVGDTLGTLDATIIDFVPSLNSAVTFYLDGTTPLWDGTVASVETDEFIGGHTFSQMTAQAPAWPGGTPTASPWDLSDTPNFSTTFPYVKLTGRKRNTEGTIMVGYTAVVDKPGLWRNMTIEVTSANFSLAAVTFLIVEISLEYQTPDAPRYTLILDESQPQLPELITDAAAGATVQNVENVPATVTVDATGLTVIDGAITVSNPEGTVIIDGTGDMFRIIASGTISTLTFSNPGFYTSLITLETGLNYAPAFAAFLATTGGNAYPVPYTQIGSGSGAHVDWYWEVWIHATGIGTTELTATVRSSVASGTTPGYTFRYYIFEQTAI
jgi:hypothetical protein